MRDISASQARGIHLHAQGLGAPRTGGSIASLRRLGSRLNAFQIDSVNVLVRAQYMPAFSRLGAYPMEALDTLAYEKRELFEYWGHAACFLPMDLYPLFRWRMELARSPEFWGGRSKDVRRFVEAVYDEVAANGPIGAGAISIGKKGSGGWWGWSDAKRAVEALFRTGRLAVARRRNFERLYDITERVIPPAVLDAPAPAMDDAKKDLLVLAAKALGVGADTDIAGYFHLENWWDRPPVKDGRRHRSQLPRLISELVADGRLVEVSVEGWDRPGYVVPGTKTPKAVHVRALLSPFDPVMWERRPTQRLFGFDYKIEIYVPAPKRVYGYYCLPFLLGDRFVARVDLKADRKSGTLLVPGAHAEAGEDLNHIAPEVAEELAEELRLVAGWLSLDDVVVGERGDLASPLSRALA